MRRGAACYQELAMNPMLKSVAMIVGLAAAGTVIADGEHLIGQKNKAFSTRSVKAKVGDKLVFRNDDPFAHNIMSLSDVQSFDLGTFNHGQARSVTLKKEGKIEIECAIHPEMTMIVDVVK
jgi:plastocyanin